MRPLVRAALVAALLLVIARFAERGATGVPKNAGVARSAPSGSAPSALLPCPAGSLPDDGACIPVPLPSAAASLDWESAQNTRRDRTGLVQSYGQIPLRPERPREYGRYLWPVPLDPDSPAITSSDDSGPTHDANELREQEPRGGVVLGAARGTAVRAAALENQIGPAELLFQGELLGTSVVTRHRVKEAAGEREYLVIYGHLQRAAATLRTGESIPEAAIIGFVGDRGGPGRTSFYLELRRVRDGVRIAALKPRELIQNARTVAVDARNLLELASR